MTQVGTAQTALLQWYDANARELPWRVPPAERVAGRRPDPYAVWLSEVMLQQTTVAAVTGYFHRFMARWPDVCALARADDGEVMGEWAGLGYYARARNLLKCARRICDGHGGAFPDTYDGLLALPGVGPYTAAAVAAIAFDLPETVVDGNVERVMARLFAIATPLPAAKGELKRAAARLTPEHRPGDHAQAVMDLGATVCTARNPSCGICPLRGQCRARAEGIAAQLPARAPRKARPVRRGIVYLARSGCGAWLLERRPDKGLLGGMLGWPTTDWCEAPQDRPPFAADWQVAGGEVRHTFTHFHLILEVRTAPLPDGFSPARGELVGAGDFRPSDLPTVMRKAYDLAHGAFRSPLGDTGRI